MSATLSLGPIGSSMSNRLTEKLNPSHLNMEDQSHEHASHKAMRERPGGAVESHFKCTIVSDAFNGKGLLARHRLVNETLADFFDGRTASVHSFSMVTKTPAEWEAMATKAAAEAAE